MVQNGQHQSNSEAVWWLYPVRLASLVQAPGCLVVAPVGLASLVSLMAPVKHLAVWCPHPCQTSFARRLEQHKHNGQYVLVCFSMFQYVLDLCLTMFDYVLVCFICFSMFQYVLVCFSMFEYVQNGFGMVSTNQTQRLFGGCTPSDSLRSSGT